MLKPNLQLDSSAALTVPKQAIAPVVGGAIIYAGASWRWTEYVCLIAS